MSRLLAATLLAAIAMGQPPGTVTLTVRVDRFPHAKGRAGIAVWNGPRGFPEGIEHAVATTYVPIEGETATARFEGLSPGSYAVTVFHDQNDNRRFDKNWVGVPREPWGVSNNVRPKLRPPTFEEARVDFEAGERAVRISVR
jgi:uncharacterized protein (DUF2141 family)